jgi:23S rRNA (cytosine1962-C5)-methyltransferase
LKTGYELLDSGNKRKLERFGSFTLSRPCAQAVWNQKLPVTAWERADAYFSREEKEGWTFRNRLPSSWEADISGIKFLIQPTEFGHLGVFPEQRPFWEKMRTCIQDSGRETVRVLNLFAYSGGSTLSPAQAGAHVCHLDASKSMVQQARLNATKNDLEGAPIRWIVEDVMKFLQREIKRNSLYDAIILDPPSFGRGTRGEVFKIEEDILELLSLCKSCLSQNPLFFLFSCHTLSFTPLTMKFLLEDLFLSGSIESGEMLLEGNNVRPVPSGTFAFWRP